ncbi:MFS multidrug transporter [Mollisia scopiformis]|uniref:MFS multidrug transporter n=1 Tax=Mollisia scopiformis TaxID=149040 RepID=A0A132B953_MOLSC|nr:MFS multidrug transporter [Mollisia scopiformis]KUJ08940.1 MFS multidrug transporter [Mollisia scopiformis]
MNDKASTFLIVELEQGHDLSHSSLSSVRLTDSSIQNTSRIILERLGLRVVEDGYVKWREDASLHPRNWSTSRKAFDILLVLMLDLFTLVSVFLLWYIADHICSTAVSSSGPSVAEVARLEFGLSRTVCLLGFGSMYQFGQAFGGVVFPPYSEAFGRKSVYLSASVVYCLSCIIVACVPSISGPFVGRFISGFVSAVPSIIVSGSIEDMFNMQQRISMMYIWACATTGGLFLGPIYGTYISHSLGWRWVFYLASIIMGGFTLLLFFIRESRPSQLLSRQLALLHDQTGSTHFRIFNPDHTPDLRTFAKVALTRPIRLFCTEPIVFVVAIMSSVGWALIYFFTEALPIIYSNFNLSPDQSSLMFLAMGVGISIGILPRIHDWRKLKQRIVDQKPLHPEDKLIGFSFAAPSLAFGLWWLSLTVPPRSHFHWSVTVVGLIPIGFATNEFACTLSGYLGDTYTIYASSAFAAMSFLRAILGGVFPLFGRPMYVSLGSNTATMIIASLATVFCATPILFTRYGRAIRKRSKFASYSLEVNNETQIHADNIE